MVIIDESQFGFVPGRDRTVLWDGLHHFIVALPEPSINYFVIRQLQEKYLTVSKQIYMDFVDIDKAFDRVPQKVIWWVMRKLGVEE